MKVLPLTGDVKDFSFLEDGSVSILHLIVLGFAHV